MYILSAASPVQQTRCKSRKWELALPALRWASSFSLRLHSLRAGQAQAQSKTCFSYEYPLAPSGWFLRAAMASPSVLLGSLPCFVAIPKTVHWAEQPCTKSSWGGKEQGLNGTGRKNELIASSSFPSAVAYSAVLSSINWAQTLPFPSKGRWFPAPWGTPAGSTAQQHRASNCLQVRTRLTWPFQHPWSLSNPLDWQSIVLPPQSCPEDQNSFSLVAGGSIVLHEPKETIFIPGFHWNTASFSWSRGLGSSSRVVWWRFSPQKRGC